MSEPTSDGNQKPDPDQQPDRDQNQGKNHGQNQDQSSGSTFNDPTAPVWADPTAPVPAPPSAEESAWVQDSPEVPPVPPTPPGATYAYGQQPAAPQTTPPVAPPVSNPYAQQPPPAPPYGQPQPGQEYPAYGQQTYATGAAPSNTSAIILTIVSGLSTLTTCVIGIPSLIFGIMALTSNSTDPVGSRKKARTGWIIYAINAGVVVLAVVALVVIFIVFSDGTRSSFNSGY